VEVGCSVGLEEEAKMSLWLERMNELSRHGRYLKEAEQHRRARELREGQQRGHAAWCRAMRWLGCRLAAWGTMLLERYGHAAAAKSAESRAG